VRAAGLRERVLYLTDAADVDANFFWHLQQDNPNGSGILIVDECTAEFYSRLRNLADGLPSGFTVVSIGPLEYDARGGALELGPLDVDELANILETFAPELTEPVRRAIAARCGGSPKLVVDLGREFARSTDSIRGWEEVERSRDLVEYLNEHMFPVEAQDPAATVMRGLSLFTRLGWWEEVAHQGRAVMDFFSVDWNVARQAAEQLILRGVVSRRGRFLYPTPDVLANYLTRETIQIREPGELSELFDILPGDAQRAFAERLRQLGEDPETQGVIREITGGAGFFRSLAALDDRATAHLLRLLAPSYPDSILRQLERVLGVASHEELIAFKAGRREVMWALEELAWWREHFTTAARLVLRLAWAENEDIANNATGIWQRFFQVVLGGTEAPYDERLPVLREALQDDDPEIRRLGVLALGAALQTAHIHRIGGPPEDTGRLPPDDWRPNTRDEWIEIIRRCLEELDPLLDDPDPTVRAQAVDVLERRGGDLINAGLLEEWAARAGRLATEPFEVRKPLLRVVTWRLRHADDLDAAQIELLERLEADLAGVAFSDRLRRVVGAWDYERERFGGSQGHPAIRELAEEALAEPTVLEPELSWLLGGDANSGFIFGKQLGCLDADDGLMEMIVGRWDPDILDDRFITGYLAGVAERRGVDWLEDRLDEWSTRPEMGLLVANTTWRALSSDRAVRRLIRLIEDGHVSPSYVGRLVAGFWARDIGVDLFRDLIVTASQDKSPAAVSGRLSVLDQYLSEYPDRLNTLRPLVDEALEDGAGLTYGSMDPYHWKNLAEQVVEDEPLHMIRLCLEVVERDEDQILEDELRDVLHRAVSIAGWRAFEEVLGPAISENTSLLWRLDNPFMGPSLLSHFDPEAIVEWVAGDVDSRLHLIAHAAPVGGGESLQGLARVLLVRWGERDEVRSALAATFGTGGWTGPESGWLAEKIGQAERWEQDPDPNVRRWAQDLVFSYRRRLEQARLVEQEE